MIQCFVKKEYEAPFGLTQMPRLFSVSRTDEKASAHPRVMHAHDDLVEIVLVRGGESRYFVGCRSVDDGKTTRRNCDVGCISCRLCEKACDSDAISVDDFVAHIDYSKCTGCGKCSDKCPRKIIKSSDIMSGRA